MGKEYFKDYNDSEFLYQMLGRLESDCKYFLGNGNSYEKHLWASTVDGQISAMKEIYNKLQEKPEWLTLEQINYYEKEMKAKLNEKNLNKTAKVIYNKLEKIVFNKQGYFDLSESKIETKKDLVNVCNIFRDPRYETFRIFYMKNDKIVGQEAITSKIPNAVVLYSKGKSIADNPIRSYEIMNSRMKRLGADGYYLAHNHISNSAIPSMEDMEVTRNFAANVDGFLGHIVLGSTDKYSIIEEDTNGRILMPKEKTLNKSLLSDMAKKLQENTLYDVKISNRDELVAVLKQVSNEKENSIAILTDCKCNIRMILDIPNKMFNQSLENLNGYFKNLGRNSGSTRVFVGTQDKYVYNKLLEHQDYGTIKDMVCFDENKELVISDEIIYGQDLFDKEKLKKSNSSRETR